MTRTRLAPCVWLGDRTAIREGLSRSLKDSHA